MNMPEGCNMWQIYNEYARRLQNENTVQCETISSKTKTKTRFNDVT